MKKTKSTLLIFIAAVFFSNFGFAQLSLSGTVFNKKTNKPLNGANVIIQTIKSVPVKQTDAISGASTEQQYQESSSGVQEQIFTKGTTTNAKGYFSFDDLEEGDYEIEIRYVGFKTYEGSINLSSDLNKKFIMQATGIELKPTIITATRTSLKKNEIPAKVDVLTSSHIKDIPATSIDELFRTIPNVVVNRSWGMFSKNSSVTMRGMDASARTLVLLNGTPLNKTAGGSVVWDMISPESIEKIELVKGPGSALYGNNAMAGVINLITKTPDSEKIKGSVSGFTGTYGLWGGNLNLGQSKSFGDKKWFWQIHSNYTKGDGYINEPEETRSEINVPIYVEEASLNLKSGLEFNPNQSLTLEYSYYNGRHGAGTKMDTEILPSGSFDHYHTNHLATNYSANFNNYIVTANVFNHWQDVDGANEKINKKGVKTINREFSDTRDYGLFLNVSKSFNSHRLLAGIDIKNGNIEGLEKSLINSDQSDFEGQMSFAGFFFQDEINLSSDLQAIVGFRVDQAKFSEGIMKVNDDEPILSDENTWNKFSPRVSLLWKLNNKNSLYTSYTTGFMPPKLDDLVRTGTVTKGYKLANPNLKPEKNTSFELGGKFMIGEKLEFEPAVYFSILDDMVYFIDTGEEIKIGSKKQPILQKQNISKAEIYGFESSLNYKLSQNFSFMAAYTYNHSTIKEFNNEVTAENYEGKFLIEVPKHQTSFSIYWKNKIANISAVYNFMDRQWFDDENTEYIEAYHTVDLKISRSILKKLKASLTIQNLLDDEFIDRKGLLSPGRFVLLDLRYNF